MNCAPIKKLEEETSPRNKEGNSVNACICTPLASQDQIPRKGIRASIKKVFASFSTAGKKHKYTLDCGQKRSSEDITVPSNKEEKGVYRTKETVKSSPSSECLCKDQSLVLNNSYANIRITASKNSCSCPEECLLSAEDSNVKITIKKVSHVCDAEDSDCPSSTYDNVSADMSTIPEAEDSIPTITSINSSRLSVPLVNSTDTIGHNYKLLNT